MKYLRTNLSNVQILSKKHYKILVRGINGVIIFRQENANIINAIFLKLS